MWSLTTSCSPALSFTLHLFIPLFLTFLSYSTHSSLFYLFLTASCPSLAPSDSSEIIHVNVIKKILLKSVFASLCLILILHTTSLPASLHTFSYVLLSFLSSSSLPIYFISILSSLLLLPSLCNPSQFSSSLAYVNCA